LVISWQEQTQSVWPWVIMVISSLSASVASHPPDKATRRWRSARQRGRHVDLTAIGDGLRSLQAAGRLPVGVTPDDLAATMLAALHGGLVLAQVERDTRPLETVVDIILARHPVNPPGTTDAAAPGRHRGQRTAAPEAKP
jgi:hypothetical protein